MKLRLFGLIVATSFKTQIIYGWFKILKKYYKLQTIAEKNLIFMIHVGKYVCVHFNIILVEFVEINH